MRRIIERKLHREGVYEWLLDNGYFQRAILVEKKT